MKENEGSKLEKWPLCNQCNISKTATKNTRKNEAKAWLAFPTEGSPAAGIGPRVEERLRRPPAASAGGQVQGTLVCGTATASLHELHNARNDQYTTRTD